MSNIVENIVTKNYLEAQKIIKEALLTRAQERIEARKVLIGKSFFENVEPVNELHGKGDLEDIRSHHNKIIKNMNKTSTKRFERNISDRDNITDKEKKAEADRRVWNNHDRDQSKSVVHKKIVDRAEMLIKQRNSKKK